MHDEFLPRHILESIESIEEYVSDGRSAFFCDKKTRDAVLRNLHTLSESALRVSADLKSRHPNTPWRDVAAFRNVVVHDYLALDLEVIWDVPCTSRLRIRRGSRGCFSWQPSGLRKLRSVPSCLRISRSRTCRSSVNTPEEAGTPVCAGPLGLISATVCFDEPDGRGLARRHSRNDVAPQSVRDFDHGAQGRTRLVSQEM